MALTRIGNRSILVRKMHLRQHEAAFILRRSEREVRNMFRRGERLRAAGASREEIIRIGALPAIYSGRNRRAAIHDVAQAIDGDLLALEALAAVVEMRLNAPRAAIDTDPAPDLLTHLGHMKHSYRSLSDTGGLL